MESEGDAIATAFARVLLLDEGVAVERSVNGGFLATSHGFGQRKKWFWGRGVGLNEIMFLEVMALVGRALVLSCA